VFDMLRRFRPSDRNLSVSELFCPPARNESLNGTNRETLPPFQRRNLKRTIFLRSGAKLDKGRGSLERGFFRCARPSRQK